MAQTDYDLVGEQTCEHGTRGCLSRGEKHHCHIETKRETRTESDEETPKPDLEIETIGVLIDRMHKLDKGGRERVIRYAQQLHYDITKKGK